jgi:hypothetical protein
MMNTDRIVEFAIIMINWWSVHSKNSLKIPCDLGGR